MRDDLHADLVRTLKTGGRVQIAEIEAAFLAVRRHDFLPSYSPEIAYRDQVVTTKVSDGIPISASTQPSMMATMLEQLGLRRGDRVLEVGTGTGYNAALMAHIVGEAGRVVTLDVDDDIVTDAQQNLRKADCRQVTCVCADGGGGYDSAAPYDRIIVTVGSWDIPPALVRQLRPGGRLVIPLSIRGPQRSIAFERKIQCLRSVSIVECDFSTTCRGEFAGPVARHQVAPEGGVYVWFDHAQRVDADVTYRRLAAPSHEAPTGVTATAREVFGGLYLWLALHAQTFFQLGVADSRLGDIRCFLRMPGKLGLTAGLFDGDSMALLSLGSDDHPVSSVEDPRPLELSICSFGANAGPGRRLADLIRAWDRSGRPGTAGLRVTAYPIDRRYDPQPVEFVIDKRWSRLVLSWSDRELNY